MKAPAGETTDWAGARASSARESIASADRRPREPILGRPCKVKLHPDDLVVLRPAVKANNKEM